MKKLTLGLFGLFVALSLHAQKKPVEEITKLITRNDAEAHLTFLAADEMRGRKVGSPEVEIAANYIASNYKQWGLKAAPGTNNNYFQIVDFQKTIPPSLIEFVVDGQTFKLKEDIIQLGGGDVDVSGEIVFVGYGSLTDFEKADVKGKIVVAFTGLVDDPDFSHAIKTHTVSKNALTKEFGGVALIEIHALPGLLWQNLAGFLGGSKTSVKKDAVGIPHFWMKNSDAAVITMLKESKTGKGSIKSVGSKIKYLTGKNVAGIVEGTDPVLKNEYIVISAHYDHVGVQNKPNQTDSIYNGARDNGIGTVGLLETARFFSKYPPKRSVLFLALTGEELGMQGSLWYADHPLIPLKQTVFDFNCDNAGYNDISITTTIGLERTSAQSEIVKGSEAFGLKAAGDAAPEQNLFDRSDNYNFAKNGVPSVNFSPGVKAFDADLMKYYHQAIDEVGSLDFDYLIKYFRAYVYTNYLIANMPKAPVWTAGDKYEAEAKKLYGK